MSPTTLGRSASSAAARTEKSPKKRTPKKAKTTTVLDKIVAAIRALRDPSSKGSSRKAIEKYVRSEFGYDNLNALKKALKKGVSRNVLVQTGQSFRVASDPIPESTDDGDKDKLVIEDLPSKKKKRPPSDDDEANTTAQPGDLVTVSYRGTLENGYEFDQASSFAFVLGAGEVIKGWDLGIASMRVGGKRKLVVPSKLGYGKRGCKPDIPSNATLNFTVTLKKLEKAPD